MTLMGADDFLIDYAQANGKDIRYFESVDTQMALLSRTDDYAQLRALKRLIRTLPQTRNQESELFESWVVGDTERDIWAAQAARFKVIAMATGHLSVDSLKEHNPDYCLPDFKDIDRFIDIILS